MILGCLLFFFADLRKPSLDAGLGKGLKLKGSYLLGKVIDWKPVRLDINTIVTDVPIY